MASFSYLSGTSFTQLNFGVSLSAQMEQYFQKLPNEIKYIPKVGCLEFPPLHLTVLFFSGLHGEVPLRSQIQEELAQNSSFAFVLYILQNTTIHCVSIFALAARSLGPNLQSLSNNCTRVGDRHLFCCPCFLFTPHPPLSFCRYVVKISQTLCRT